MGWGTDVINGLVDGAQGAGDSVVDGVSTAASATVDGFENAANRVRDQLTPDIRPEGTSGHRIYVWFHHGPGTESLDNAVDGWRRVSEHHVAAAEAVNSAMGKIRTSWQGDAAGAAIDASRPLRDAADNASKAARRAGEALSAQSFGFNETRKNVVDVAPEPPMLNPLAGGFGAVDHHAEAQAYTADQQANQACLHNYGTRTDDNAGRVPRFDATSDGTRRGEVTSPTPITRVSGEFVGPVTAGSHAADTGSGAPIGTGPTGGSGPPGGQDPCSEESATPGGSGSEAGGSGQVSRTGGSCSDVPAGTASSWYDGEDGNSQGGGFAYGTSHGLSGSGLAAGAAGVAAGGVAVLGGGVLGEHTGGRGGISGRGIAGFGSGPGTGGGRTPASGAGTPASGGRGGGSPLGGRAGGVTPTTAASGAVSSRAGAPPAGAAGRGRQGEEDEQHERPEWLTAEDGPDELFGTHERTAPPVLGALPSEQDTERC